MITKHLIERIYSAASIQRWNDHVRPLQFTELDKQAHKMIIAYVIARFEEEADRKEEVRWIDLIDGGIFEFLHRITLTDIKPAVFHEMMSQKGRELNRWILEELAGDIGALEGDFRERFERYFFDDRFAHREKRILKAAHYIATNWEFRIIYTMNPLMYGIEKTKEEIENQIEDHYDLIGVQKISLGMKSSDFLDMCGQLRFQQRWAQAPRIPPTSVLGHMLIVALLSYLCAREIGACSARLRNDFFAALMHDLPEILTRDIVSPIKRSVTGLDAIIKAYEKEEVEGKILPLLPASWHDEFRYFVENEFKDRIRRDGTVVTVDGIDAGHNRDVFSPVDGKVIEVCDKLSAFVEADLSLSYGIRSKRLEEAKQRLYDEYGERKVSGFDFGPLFDYFQYAGAR